MQGRTAELSLANQQLSQEAAKVRAQAEWLDAANDAIFVGASDERITYWNKGAERLYGWSRTEALGKSAHELLRTEFPLPFAEIARLRELGREYRLSARLRGCEILPVGQGSDAALIDRRVAADGNADRVNHLRRREPHQPSCTDDACQAEHRRLVETKSSGIEHVGNFAEHLV